MYDILLHPLKLVPTISIFYRQKIFVNNDKKCFLFYQKLLLSSRFSDFVLPSLSLSWLLLILLKKLIYDKFLSLFDHYVPKMNFKNGFFS